MKALLLIDMKKHDVDSLWNKETIVPNQVRLMTAFKKAGGLVFLVNGGLEASAKNPVMLKLWGDESKDKEGNLLSEEQKNVIPELDVYDYYIEKPEYSAFYKTNIEELFKKHDVDEVYLAGIYAGCCIYFTGADAAMRGIQPFIISDAVASPSDEATKMNIENFETFMGPAITTQELIEKVTE